MNRIAVLRCPYCGREMEMLVESDYGQKALLQCCASDGGCGRYFVADIMILFDTKCRKIEGEQESDIHAY